MLLRLILGIVLMITATGAAEEWTRFRGPNGAGVAPDLEIPNEWKAEHFTFIANLPAGGHSAPVFWGKKVFLTGADDNTTAERTVFALNADTGEEIWNLTIPSKFHKKHKLNSFAAATPAVDEDHVYVAFSTPDDYTLIAYSHDGEPKWTRHLGPYVSQHSCGSSPIVYKDMVILINEQDKKNELEMDKEGKSSILAFDRKTGDTKWSIERESAIVPYSTPCVYQSEGEEEVLLFNSTAHGITAIDPGSGKTIWEVNGGLLDKRSVSSPVILSNGLITASCGSGAGGNYLVAVKPGTRSEPRSGSVAYKIDKAAPYVPTPIALGNLVFLWCDNGVVSCHRAGDGEQLWRQRIEGTFYGSPIVVGDRLIAVSTDGVAYVLAAKEKFEELGKTDLGDLCHSTPSVAYGRLYIRTLSKLYCIGEK